MKIDLKKTATEHGSGRLVDPVVWGETERLTDVVLCAPDFLAPVPCCSVTRERLRDGFETSKSAALDQQYALRRALLDVGVTCHMLASAPGMPDLSFTRDVAATTPWSVTVLNPATAHRRREAEHFALALKNWTGSEATRISHGVIEGGDVCIARPGLLIIGVTGERTDDLGAATFATPFLAEGWEVLTYRFDPHFLHLDTIFCMIDANTALGCTDVLDDAFLARLAARGIKVLPVTYKESRQLGCNIVSLDGHKLLANAATPRVSAMMRSAGFDVIELAIDQFAACGGGLHCITMPLARRSNPGGVDTRLAAQG
jgi:N-dimethylarginine dimethylaminohydrolase